MGAENKNKKQSTETSEKETKKPRMGKLEQSTLVDNTPAPSGISVNGKTYNQSQLAKHLATNNMTLDDKKKALSSAVTSDIKSQLEPQYQPSGISINGKTVDAKQLIGTNTPPAGKSIEERRKEISDIASSNVNDALVPTKPYEGITVNGRPYKQNERLRSMSANADTPILEKRKNALAEAVDAGNIEERLSRPTGEPQGVTIDGRAFDANEYVQNGSNRPITPALDITPAEKSYNSAIDRDADAQYQEFVNRQAEAYKAQQAQQLEDLKNKNLSTERKEVSANNQPAMPDPPFKFSYNPSNVSKEQEELNRITSEDGTNPQVMNAISGTPSNESAPQTPLEKAENMHATAQNANPAKPAEPANPAEPAKPAEDNDVLSQANRHLPKEFHERLNNEMSDFLKNNNIPMINAGEFSVDNINWDKLSAKQSKLLRSKFDEQEALKIKIYERNRAAGFYDENAKLNPNTEENLKQQGMQSVMAQYENKAKENFDNKVNRVQENVVEEEELNTLEAMLAKLKKDAEKDKTDAQKMQQYYALADVLKKLGQMGGGIVGGAIGGNVLDSMPNIGEYKESRGYLDAFEQAKKANERLRSFDDKEFNLALREDDRRYQKEQEQWKMDYAAKEKALDREWQMTFAEYQNKMQQANAEQNFERQAALQKELAEKKHEYDVALTNLRGEWEVKQRKMSRYRGGGGGGGGAKASTAAVTKADKYIDYEDGTQLAVTKDELNAISEHFIGSTFQDANGKTVKVTKDNINVFRRRNPDKVNSFIEKRRKNIEAAAKADTGTTGTPADGGQTPADGTETKASGNIFSEMNKKNNPGFVGQVGKAMGIQTDLQQFAPKLGVNAQEETEEKKEVDLESFLRKEE